MNAAFIAEMTDADIAEAIHLNDWKLTSADVEISDAERAFVQADQDALTAERDARRLAQPSAVCDWCRSDDDDDQDRCTCPPAVRDGSAFAAEAQPAAQTATLTLDGRSVTVTLARTADGPLVTLEPGEGLFLDGIAPAEYALVERS